MNLLSAGYNALVGEKGQVQTVDETVDRLCERLKSASLLEDRRGAVQGLKGLSREYKLQVGTKSLEILIKVLNSDDTQDVEVTKAVLETLINLCSIEKKESELGLQFTEIFVKDTKNVSTLIALLEINDFYVRYNTIQLFSTLLINKPRELQDSILVSPMGVSKLVDLLDDNREIVRNEALLLLISLTRTNADIQKIIAFENTFERLLEIIIEDGGIQGDIVVSDCLVLMYNLLKDNMSNQKYFRETSCLAKLVHLFNDGQVQWNKQSETNMISAMALIRILCVPDASNTSGNQNAFLSSQVLTKITAIAFTNELPETIKPSALYAVGDMIYGNEKNQDFLLKFVKATPPLSVVHIAIRMALDKTVALNVRFASAFVIESYLEGNSNAQLTIAGTFAGDDKSEDRAPGNLILSVLSDWTIHRKDPHCVWLASYLLSLVIYDNPTAKKLLLNTASFLSVTMQQFSAVCRESKDVKLFQVAYLKLLITLFDESSMAVGSFLEESSNLPFIIERANTTNELQGLSCMLLGLCYLYLPDDCVSITKSNLHSILVNRIGLDVFFTHLRKLKDSSFFSGTQWGPDVPVNDILFEMKFTLLYREILEKLQRMITSQLAKSPKKSEKVELPSATDPSKEIEALKAKHQSEMKAVSQKCEDLSLQLNKSNSEVQNLKHELQLKDSELENLRKGYNELKTELEDTKAQFGAQTKEHDDLLVLLAELDEELNRCKGRLKELGEDE